MKAGLILLMLVSLVALGMVSIDIYAEHEEYVVIDIEYFNYEWTSICQLTNLEPFYDCPESVNGYFDMSGEEWMIFVLDDYEFPDPVGVFVYGFAVYSDTPGEDIGVDDELSLCAFFPEFRGTNTCTLNYMVIGKHSPETCYSPYPCTSVFEHEIKHLTCKCDWHEGLEGKPVPIII